ncbi:hypothetical protein E2P61_06750 [Candidatus Bathyarchaeota archaeon]|nr:hypothetical protein E2P61_06750 [Candidatus Bathyarchaeota archaeon]
MHIEERVELRGDILEKRENPIFRVLIPESVENETVSRNERVSVRRIPFSYSRFETPRKR